MQDLKMHANIKFSLSLQETFHPQEQSINK
jgi:hypothetical protein